MAEEVIGLRIKLNGMDTVIQDVETFEKLLKEAREDLKQIPIGSDNFKQLKNEIANADKQLAQLNNEQKQTKKDFKDISDIGNAVTGAFAGATAAIALFGGESEKMTTAQKVASEALTVVLTVQSLAQIKLGETTLRTAIAQRAQTIATATSNTALKALFTTISANPVGALVAVIGLAVAAFMAFADSASAAEDAQADFNKAVAEDAGKNIATFKALTAVIDDTSLSLETRKEKIEELRKQYPQYLAGMSNEDILLGRLKDSYDEIVEAIKTAARARAAKTILDKLAVEELQKEQEVQAKLAELQNAYYLPFAGVQVPRLKSQYEALNKELEDIRASQQKYIDIIDNSQKAEEEYAETLRKEREEQERLKKAKDEAARANEENLKRQEELLSKVLKIQQEQIKLAFTTLKIEGELDSKLLDDLTKLLDESTARIKKRNEQFITEEQSFTQEVRDLFLDIIPTIDEISGISDTYYDAFTIIKNVLFEGGQDIINKEGDTLIKDYRQIIQKLAGTISKPEEWEKFKNGLGKSLQESTIKAIEELEGTGIERATKIFNILVGEGQLSPEQQNLLNEYINLINDFVQKQILSKSKIGTQPIQIFKFDEKDQSTLLKNLIDFSTKYQEIAKKNITDIERQNQLNALFNEYLNDQSGLFAAGSQDLETYQESVSNAKQGLIEFSNQLQKQADDSEKANGKINELKDNLQGLQDVTSKIVSDEQLLIIISRFKEYADESAESFNTLLNVIKTNSAEFEKRLGSEGYLKLLQSLMDNTEDLSNKTREELTSMIANYQRLADLIKYEFTDEAAQPLQDWIDKLNAALNALPTDAEEQFQEFAQKFNDAVQEMQKTLGQLGTFISDSFTFELEKAAYEYNLAMNSIVGDTKEANEKRIELEKGYQKEKKQLEKQARLASLKLQLAETSATAAANIVQSINAAKGDPILSAIFIAINSTIAAAQIALIAQQIQFVSAMRRGGKLAGGGLVMGPSHEYGGVKYANGGVELEGNEAVINRQSTIQYGSLLSSINQAQGGRPILVGNAMDSRLIEVLAKQKQEPIRAYVIEQDITKAQNINRKLEQLASF